MNFDFGEVLTRAWNIIWKYKVLWIFGILEGCSRGGNSSNSNSRSSSGGDLFSNEITRDLVAFFQQIGVWFENNLWAIFALVGLFIVIWLIQITLSNIGHIGLVRGVYHADMDVEEIRFGGLWNESLTYFWRVIGLSLTVWGPVILFFIGLGVMFILSASGQSGYAMEEAFTAAFGLLFLALCCILLPVMLLLGLFYSQSIRAMVLEELGILDSLKRGWEVLTKNFMGLAVMGIVLGIISVIISVVIAIPVYIAVIPLVFQFMTGAVDSWTPVWVTLGVLCAYTPIAWVLNGILVTYTETVWTLIYIRITDLKNKKTDFIISNA